MTTLSAAAQIPDRRNGEGVRVASRASIGFQGSGHDWSAATLDSEGDPVPEYPVSQAFLTPHTMITPTTPVPNEVAQRLSRLIYGRSISHAIGAAAGMRIADHLADRAMTSEELAKVIKADRKSVYRLLRALASIGIFEEDGLHRFQNTPTSNLLRQEVPGSLRLSALYATHPIISRAWVEFPFSARTGRSAFRKAFGQGIFDYFAKHRNEAKFFLRVYKNFSPPANELEIIGLYDFSTAKTLIDIGGGSGRFLAMVLSRTPGLRGVLFDLPKAVAGAPGVLKGAGVFDRCSVVGGSFLKRIPRGGDLYMIMRVLQSLDDATCVRVIREVRAASEPGTRLLIMEKLIKDGNVADALKLADLQSLVVTDGGRERSANEYGELLEAGGFAVNRVVGPGKCGIAIVEGIRS